MDTILYINLYKKTVNKYNTKIVVIGDIKAIEVEVTNSKNKIFVTTIYRSPSSSPTEFNLSLNKYLRKRNNQNNIHVLIGDININILSISKFAEDTRYPYEICLDHAFIKTNHDNPRNSFIFKYIIFQVQ